MCPNVFIGTIAMLPFVVNEEPDDDELLDETPLEVLQILGFDPLDELMEDAE